MPEKDWFDVDVISCAAPNLRYMSQHDKNWKKNVTDKKLFDIYKKRMNRILDIARDAKSEVIILGAFGCGAFANPPELVTTNFQMKRWTKKLTFGIIWEKNCWISERKSMFYFWEKRK